MDDNKRKSVKPNIKRVFHPTGYYSTLRMQIPPVQYPVTLEASNPSSKNNTFSEKAKKNNSPKHTP